MAKTFRIKEVDVRARDRERQRVLGLMAACVCLQCVREVDSTAVPEVVGKQDLDFLALVAARDFARTRSSLDERFERSPEQLSNDLYQG
jgi:hypothetical protein